MNQWIFGGRVILFGEEIPIPNSLSLADIIAIAETLPVALRHDTEAPSGLGIYPPRMTTGETTPYVVRLFPGCRDIHGNPQRTPQQKGIVGCVFRNPRGVVIRCWFPGDNVVPTIGPIDVRPGQIESIPALYVGKEKKQAPLYFDGWVIGRLDIEETTESGLILVGR